MLYPMIEITHRRGLPPHRTISAYLIIWVLNIIKTFIYLDLQNFSSCWNWALAGTYIFNLVGISWVAFFSYMIWLAWKLHWQSRNTMFDLFKKKYASLFFCGSSVSSDMLQCTLNTFSNHFEHRYLYEIPNLKPLSNSNH